mmetsp:Transcript_90117/g.176445  ORF Transcript_90117/g.176445 Transcript_90117/m.176445 type:complete len:145 (-) Transcript_90117:24-458(-)
MAPRTTVDDSDKALDALSTLRTPATTDKPGCAANRSKTRRPVCPVAPATTTFLMAALLPASSAMAGSTPTVHVPAPTKVATPAAIHADCKAVRRSTSGCAPIAKEEEEEEDAVDDTRGCGCKEVGANPATGAIATQKDDTATHK